ncbi:hypothetical protein [Flagellimonas myxillae]|uniref:hypothetical protein n=1 Tax=Flagellimonas myxillae TaxID=2942214 RepID=UPI00201F1F13|nr:hypothetical protein [Muricauda myxillae]MCL6266221.1 hypothetical protein [Muricauda myxillae]
MIRKINKLIVQSPLHKTALKLHANKIYRSWSKENSRILGHKTIYSISPYKTGTTFLASCFDYEISRHEPIHHASVKKIGQDFDGYFVRRLNSLNLKLEASGFWSAYIDQLAAHPIGKELTYICVLRKPCSWATSVVNHWYQVKKYGQHYFWTNELYWKKIVGVDLANFFEYSEEEKLEVVSKLIKFYMSFTEKTAKLENVHYVWIKDLQNFVPTLEQLMEEEAKLEKSEKNTGLLRQYTYENNEIDESYMDLVNSLVKNQVKS